MNRKEKINLVVNTIKEAGEALSGYTILEKFFSVGSNFDAYYEGLTHAIRLHLINSKDEYHGGIPYQVYYVVKQPRRP